MLLKLAWRNIWRNKRRTLITMSSIVFAVLLCVLLDSIKKGMLDKMKENLAGFYTGYVQLHDAGYWEEKTLENSFVFDENVATEILKNKEVSAVIPRLESYTLAAYDEYAKGCMIIGIDPEGETAVTNLKSKLSQGNYLLPDDKAVLLPEGLASYLKMGLNDTLVLIGQGYHGISAVGKYPVKGLVRFGSPELNKGLVYLPLKEAQYLFGTDNRLTALVVQLHNIKKAEKVAATLTAGIGTDFEVMDWKEMLPELNSFIEGEEAENVIFQFVLYLLIAFGIFGTILMMTLERQREFGILTAIGMKKTKLSAMVILESSMISLAGAFFGILISVPFVYYFYKFPIRVSGQLAEAYENFGLEPVFYFSIEPIIFYTQAIIVLVLALVLSVYPLFRIMKMETVSAMRS